MEHPLQLTFRGLESTEALRQAVEERAQKLEHFYDKIESCHVIVETPHRHHHQGNVYHIRIRLTVPGEEIVVSRDPPEHAQHEDLYLAINDAFKETTRRVEDYVRRRRGQAKQHVGPPHGRVVRLFEDEGMVFSRPPTGERSISTRTAFSTGPFTGFRWAQKSASPKSRGRKGRKRAR